MHEVDMTRALLQSLQTWRQGQAAQHPCVRRVHLQVGAFTCVEPDQLLVTWRAVTAGSWLQGAELAIETIALRARCLGCGASYGPRVEQAYRSPCCDHPLEQILSGRELRIRSVEYDLSDPGPDPKPESAAAAVQRGSAPTSHPTAR